MHSNPTNCFFGAVLLDFGGDFSRYGNIRRYAERQRMDQLLKGLMLKSAKHSRSLVSSKDGARRETQTYQPKWTY